MAGDFNIEPVKPISRLGSRPCDPSRAFWPSTASCNCEVFSDTFRSDSYHSHYYVTDMRIAVVGRWPMKANTKTKWASHKGIPHRGRSSSKKANNVHETKQAGVFNTQAFFESSDVARTIRELNPKEVIFFQGDACKEVMYIQKGHVQLSVVSKTGKEAVVAILKTGDFLGEDALAGQQVRIASATATTPTTLLVIDLKEMLRLLHEEHDFSNYFISYVVNRKIRMEEDLIDQLFNSSEKRLARTLLLLARYGNHEKPQFVLPKISQETLAGMIGTTRSRVNFFMKKFEKLGFIHYNGGLHVNDSLLNVVLHD